MLALLWDQLAEVWHALRAHKFRSALTLLGMIIGAGSLVLLAGLLSGGEAALRATNQDATGADLIQVDAAAAPRSGRGRTQRPLEGGDADALRAASALSGAMPGATPGAMPGTIVEGVVYRYGMKARYRDQVREVMLFGVSPQALTTYRLELSQGRFLDPDDLRHRARVCVVGHELWREVLGEPAVLDGIRLLVGGTDYAVVGVLEHKASLGGDQRRGGTWDGRVIVPVTTLQMVQQGDRRVQRINLRLPLRPGGGVGLAALLEPARQLTGALLLRRHYNIKNFKVDQDQESAQKEQVIFLVINVLMLCTAGLSLLVGGINIMNIMLVTVTERTREIGVRLALGATRGWILGQFLLEAALLAGLGGALGVLAGIGLVAAASHGLRAALGLWTACYEPWAMALGFLSAVGAGVVFGLYPAWRAARLDPVEALRYE